MDSGDEVNRLPWVEKYRPTALQDICSQQEITKTLQKWIETNKLPHLLFYGPPGTGKTTSILAVARQLYSDKQRPSMVMELNASDDRGIGVVREEIITFSQTKGLHSFASTIDPNSKTNVKLVILDEADAMTKDAQNALRRVIEKYTENVRFCIICNYLSNIIPAIQSRCTKFRFAPLDVSLIKPRLEFVAEQEKVNLTKDGEKALLDLSGGDMRRVLNILQSASMAFSTVDESAIYKCVGQPEPKLIKNLLNILLNEDIASCCKRIEEEYLSQGYALSDVLTRLHSPIFSMDVPPEVTCLLLKALADAEQRLSVGCSDRLQSASLVAAFIKARKLLREAAPMDCD